MGKEMSYYKSLLDNLFRLAIIDRWNDHPKPFDISELDKQAHKAIIAYILAKIEEKENDKKIDWPGLIDGIIFEALQRAVLTDIKPRLFHKLMRTKKEQINEFVLRELEYIVKGISEEWYKRFRLYLFKDSFLEYEKKIIQAAHFLSTYWEFQFIYNVSKGMYTIEQEKQEIENRLEDFHNLLGVQRFLLRKKLYGFINLCGQLRFQKRWIQTVRIPRTSVMGHMLMVAILSYVALKRENIDNEKCLYSTFMASLFHDLPEIITRDIISNLKKELTKGEDIIKIAEIEGVKEEIYPLLPEYIRKELSCFLAICENLKESPNVNEFSNRKCEFTNTETKLYPLDEEADFRQICTQSIGDNYLLIPGKLIKEADIASAYAEAVYSINYGLRSQELISDAKKIRERLLSTTFAEIAEALKIN
jgi:putative hydrolase of HD superfamily